MQLVPFNFQGFKTSEAIWGDHADQLRRLRFTRKGWGELFGAKQPQKYIDKLAERYPDLPKGVTVTVTATDGKNYLTFTLDIYDGFQYATYSDLPQAKDFVRRFPDFLTAILNRRILPPPVDIATLAHMRPWSREAAAERKRIAQEKGKSEQTIRRIESRLRAGEPVNKPRPKGESAVHKKHRHLYNNVIEIYRQGKTLKEIETLTGVPFQTACRWINKRLN